MLLRVLGIDPGIAITGYAVLEQQGSKIKTIDYGCVRTSSDMPHVKRLEVLYRDINTVLQTFRPQVAAVEKLYFNRNVTTALKVGEARGVVLLSLSLANVPISEYTPLQVKQAVVGYGRAEKQQMQYMVKTLLGLPEAPRPDDAADACAVAITHLFSHKLGSVL